MSGNNSILKDEWIRLNVGGKVFQTTKDTLSRYPDTFLARLVNGGLSSDKDESGAYLIDADPEHFRTILNYLRRGNVTLDASKVILGDLLREADFFNVEPLVVEIRQAMSAPDQMTAMTNRILAKIDDMSKKLSNIGSMPTMPSTYQPSWTQHHAPMPYRPSPPRCQNCNKTMSCCNDPKPQKQSLSEIMMQGGLSMERFTYMMPFPSPQSIVYKTQGAMVCRNCNKIINCCNDTQLKMTDYHFQGGQ